MRIWSKQLISVLPTKQLKAMRYELGDMIKQYPNIKHPLVKFANNYGIEYLGSYFREVILEYKKRNINMSEKYNIEITNTIYDKLTNDILVIDLFEKYYKFEEDNSRYLRQCYFNLQEKYDRGIITEEEWDKIDEFYTREVMGYGN